MLFDLWLCSIIIGNCGRKRRWDEHIETHWMHLHCICRDKIRAHALISSSQKKKLLIQKSFFFFLFKWNDKMSRYVVMFDIFFLWSALYFCCCMYQKKRKKERNVDCKNKLRVTHLFESIIMVFWHRNDEHVEYNFFSAFFFDSFTLLFLYRNRIFCTINSLFIVSFAIICTLWDSKWNKIKLQMDMISFGYL